GVRGSRFRARRALPSLPKGGTAHIRWIFQDGPDHPPFPYKTAGACPFAGLHQASADLADREPVAPHPGKDVAPHPRLLGEHVIARLSATVVLIHIPVAIRGAAQHMNRAGACRMEFTPA